MNGRKFSFAPAETKIQLFNSYIVTELMSVRFGVIHTDTLLENLLLIIVTHSDALLMSRDTPAQVWHLQWTQLTISINVVFRKSAYSLMSRVTNSTNTIVAAIVNSYACHQSTLIGKWESMLYVSE